MPPSVSDSLPDEPMRYAVRLSEKARREIDAATAYLADVAGDTIADAWQDGLLDAVSTLRQFPSRCPIVPEADAFTREVRHLIYRRPGAGRSSPAYRVLFEIREGGGEGLTVFILHVRYGGMAPIDTDAAREIERAQ